MRWSIIRLIWLRELRDQLRDRRTLFTIVALPLLMYPLLTVAVISFAGQLLNQKGFVGVVAPTPGSTTFPERNPPGTGLTPAPVAALLSATGSGSCFGVDQLTGAAAFHEASHIHHDFFVFLEEGEIVPFYRWSLEKPSSLLPGKLEVEFQFLKPSEWKEALRNKQVDVVLMAPPNFMDLVSRGEQPILHLKTRKNDDNSLRTAEQLRVLLHQWQEHLKEVRFRQEGKPHHFDMPFALKDHLSGKEEDIIAAENLLNMLVRTFPFLLVMWSLVGALHPAVDLCAGEKERGTMETLLISPAGREEIVLGKFLTIWVFSAGTSIMHLASMGISTWFLRTKLPDGVVTVPALLWCVLLVLPLSAFFSAISIAIGAYARSTKEGQYYLMPMFWVSLPLVMLTMVPGVELNQFYSMLPVTGVALLMQRLMMANSLQHVPWLYFLPVFSTVILYSWIALRWAVVQFQSEEVLFRTSERFNIGAWVRHLFRDKEATPTPVLAIMCFAILCVLRWLSLGLGEELSLSVRTCIVLAAFVAAPPLLMALILTKRPRRSLNLYLSPLPFVVIALLLIPMAELGHYIMNSFPSIMDKLQDRRSLAAAGYLELGSESFQTYWLHYFVILGFLPALCKELAFRGFILNGLRRKMPLWPAIFLSSFLFAVFHMNVFALIPAFLLGVAAGVLAVRSGSLIPGIILHTGCNILILGEPMVKQVDISPGTTVYLFLIPITLLCAGLAFWIMLRMSPRASEIRSETDV